MGEKDQPVFNGLGNCWLVSHDQIAQAGLQRMNAQIVRQKDS